VSEDPGFLSRWSRRKTQARQGVALETPASPQPDPAGASLAPPAPALVPAPASLPAQSVDGTAPGAVPPESAKPPPTMADVTHLTRESDFSRFVAPDVDGDVKNAALKKLFGDPHFNVMDGLDIYIDDYSKPDPLPASMLRKMAQAAFLGLVDPEPAAATAAPPTAQAPKSAEVDAAAAGSATTPEPNENADLRLQPHDAAGCGSAEDRAAADTTGQH
jgi:hypothetical protein